MANKELRNWAGYGRLRELARHRVRTRLAIFLNEGRCALFSKLRKHLDCLATAEAPLGEYM